VREVTSYCRICAAACGIVVSVDGDHVVSVRGDPEHPVSRGYTCPKGRALPAWHHGVDRLDHPNVRGRAATWGAALDDLAAIIQGATAANGPDAVGAYLATGLAYDINGWMTAERFLRRLGTRQRYTPVTVDNAPVLRAAELVTGTSELNTVWQPDRSTLLLLFGTNPVVSHGYGTTLADPVTRLREFRASGGAVWVLDPRRSETAAQADHHVSLRPGSDHMVLAWLVRELLVDGADRAELDAYCDPADLECLAAAVAPFALGRVARTAGVDTDQLVELLAAVRRAGRLAAMCGTGVTMSRDGVVAEWLRWVLLIVTGSVDREGGMRCNHGWLFPLETRAWPTDPPADGSFESGASTRPELPRWLGQYPCVALADEIERGPLRVLIVAGGNPLTALPDTERTRAALARLDALVVLDVVSSELTELATHVLPVAGQLERDDVSMLENVAFANGTQHTTAVVPPGALRRPVWWVLGELARRLDFDVLGGIDPERCTDATLLRGLTAGSRGGYDEIVAGGPHGVSAPSEYGWVHDKVLPGRRWRIAPVSLVARLAAAADLVADTATAPVSLPGGGLVLAPRRRVRSMNSARYVTPVDAAREPAELRLNPDDAAALGVDDGARVRLTSANGDLDGIARRDPAVRRGVVSCTHGVADVNVARLTSAATDLDPETGMPQASGVPLSVRVMFVRTGQDGA
jgi:anaerobic selenocysteine-containing dehydrogenase